MEPHGTQTLPLFPLGMVVFPNQTLPLHIFEERYKQMIADCALQREGEDYGPFGMSFEHEGDIAPIGCAVQVLKVTRRYSNGTFDVICRGAWRYRAIEVEQNVQPYLTARVEMLEDEEAEFADPAMQQLVREHLRRLMDQASQEMGSLGYGPQTDDLDAALQGLDEGDTFVLAQRIGLEPVRRQKLLELLSENARLQYLAEFLEELLPKMQQRQDRQRRVKTNGHTPTD